MSWEPKEGEIVILRFWENGGVRAKIIRKSGIRAWDQPLYHYKVIEGVDKGVVGFEPASYMEPLSPIEQLVIRSEGSET